MWRPVLVVTVAACCSLHCFTLPHKWYRWVQYQSDINWVTAEDLIDKLSRMPSDQSAAVSKAGNAQTSAATAADAPGAEIAGAGPGIAGVAGRPAVAVTQELAARQARQDSQ